MSSPTPCCPSTHSDLPGVPWRPTDGDHITAPPPGPAKKFSCQTPGEVAWSAGLTAAYLKPLFGREQLSLQLATGFRHAEALLTRGHALRFQLFGLSSPIMIGRHPLQALNHRERQRESRALPPPWPAVSLPQPPAHQGAAAAAAGRLLAATWCTVRADDLGRQGRVGDGKTGRRTDSEAV